MDFEVDLPLFYYVEGPIEVQESMEESLSLLAILPHFAAYTYQKHSSLTYLLKLHKFYKPEVVKIMTKIL